VKKHRSEEEKDHRKDETLYCTCGLRPHIGKRPLLLFLAEKGVNVHFWEKLVEKIDPGRPGETPT